MAVSAQINVVIITDGFEDTMGTDMEDAVAEDVVVIAMGVTSMVEGNSDTRAVFEDTREVYIEDMNPLPFDNLHHAQQYI